MGDSSGAGGFSTNDKLVLEREVDCPNEDVLASDDLASVFELDRCVKWIKDNQLSSVTLQFPDSLIRYAPHVASHIQARLGVNERYACDFFC